MTARDFLGMNGACSAIASPRFASTSRVNAVTRGFGLPPTPFWRNSARQLSPDPPRRDWTLHNLFLPNSLHQRCGTMSLHAQRRLIRVRGLARTDYSGAAKSEALELVDKRCPDQAFPFRAAMILIAMAIEDELVT